MQPELIASSSSMDNLLERLRDSKLLAVDTEFFRETSYYPELALVQIATESIVACIDPLAFDAKPALRKILLDQQITKIFHSCSQDMEVLFYYLGDIPRTIYDTQIANALISEQHQISYAALVENELGIQLDKSRTRTNWLRRPLSDKQIQYAGDDVFYLYQLHNILDEKLLNSDRQSWFDEESLALSSDSNSFQLATDKLWKRVKGATRLKRSQLAIVQAIAQWRESLAQEKNLTRKRVLSDDIVIGLALKSPENISALDQSISSSVKHINNRRHSFCNEDKQRLLDAIAVAKKSSVDTWPDNQFNLLNSQQKTLLKSLQHSVSTKAEQLGISSAIICSRKELEKLILHYANNRQLQQLELAIADLTIVQGWRYDCIGQQLINILKSTMEDAMKDGMENVK